MIRCVNQHKDFNCFYKRFSTTATSELPLPNNEEIPSQALLLGSKNVFK